jgi:hypothetical protein
LWLGRFDNANGNSNLLFDKTEGVDFRWQISDGTDLALIEVEILL